MRIRANGRPAANASEGGTRSREGREARGTHRMGCSSALNLLALSSDAMVRAGGWRMGGPEKGLGTRKIDVKARGPSESLYMLFGYLGMLW